MVLEPAAPPAVNTPIVFHKGQLVETPPLLKGTGPGAQAGPPWPVSMTPCEGRTGTGPPPDLVPEGDHGDPHPQGSVPGPVSRTAWMSRNVLQDKETCPLLM